jgi:mannosyltransferase OCH1-like enzyme
MIPKILHRTVPEETSAEVERWWDQFQWMHPDWEAHTWREPIDPADFPMVGHLLDACKTGAQRADLIRLELLVTHGGVYIDSDCEPVKPFDSLLPLPAFAGWEDETTVPNFVMGAEAANTAMLVALQQTIARNVEGADTWHCGTGVTTEVFPTLPHEITLLPPGAFAPYHYHEKRRKAEVQANPPPWCWVIHHWHHSWGTPAERRAIARNQR